MYLKQMSDSKLVIFVSGLIFPKYNAFWFLFYMYIKYYSVYKRLILYKLKTVSDDVLYNFVRKYQSHCDNNIVVVHPNAIYENDTIIELYHKDTDTSRVAFILPDGICQKDCIYISDTMFSNSALTDCNIKLIKPRRPVKIADEIELSLISSPHDISNVLIDDLIMSYFELPKIVYQNDILTLNVKHLVTANYYSDLKVNITKKIYFKCIKVFINNLTTSRACLCVVGKTTIKQVPNTQSFVPKVLSDGPKSVKMEEAKHLADITVCPYYLEIYRNIAKAVASYIENFGRQELEPLFLIEGEEGCGEKMILSSLAAEFGIHHLSIDNSDLTANVYAQYESKLNNIFFTAKISAPCVVSISSFQNFGKNNEGQYDQRLINAFSNYLHNLFFKNVHPVIVVCCSNSKDISPELKRLFLEIFEINPPSEEEREEILKWILSMNDISVHGLDLKCIANTTHGFYFKDLEALVYYAENNFYQSHQNSESVCLNEDNFQCALDFMQTNYKESIGAPKVPKVQWSDVGGLNDVKNEIIKTINLPLKHPEAFANSGLSRSGILLFGPPGTGKTLLAKAVATECNLCFLTVKGPELLNMYVGQSEQNIREVFQKARMASPCIIFFDELDSLAPNRGISGDSGGVMDRVVSQLLAEMDGLESTGKVFVIGATNRPDLIDPGLLRPGRFDKLLYIGPCTDIDSKVSVLTALTRRFKLSDGLDLKLIVESCPDNITGADFYGICSSAWTSAAKKLIEHIEKDGHCTDNDNFNDTDVIVSEQDFMLAIKNVKPSLKRDIMLSV
ncbi:peroxisomal biogenesis factor 6 isoform X1 [Rhynchophorus ferrugineus]|uniref:peroxisomal biogenesis factor 6 isoform X1 n=1 Tax=Rhynchophorus ferrugineus TaxID=354439 RepID=UPI003FCE0A11